MDVDAFVASLDGRVPMAKRRQIRRELRSNLIEAAQQVGAERAIQQHFKLMESLASPDGLTFQVYRYQP